MEGWNSPVDGWVRFVVGVRDDVSLVGPDSFGRREVAKKGQPCCGWCGCGSEWTGRAEVWLRGLGFKGRSLSAVAFSQEDNACATFRTVSGQTVRLGTGTSSFCLASPSNSPSLTQLISYTTNHLRNLRDIRKSIKHHHLKATSRLSLRANLQGEVSEY